ncbi:hypothetical protein [Bacteroides sp.]
MEQGKKTRQILLCLVLVLVGFSTAHAQLVERVCKSDYEINPDDVGALSVELDNISFFKDNEYAGTVMKGYSLPGLWLQPKGVYYPLKNIKLELGVHALIYSGAYKFPNFAYHDIATWKGNQYQRGTHILPYFRAQLALSSVNLVLGNIYGGANHGLIAPMYNQELNLTADPEMGFQFLHDSRYLHLDAWVNWQSFIFEEDTHQESFVVGLSSRVKFNDPESRFHYYLPVQMTIQHRGGEQDTIYTNSVQTLMNASIGAGMTWNANRKILKRVNVEVDALGYYQQAGKLWPFGKGAGLYASAFVDLKDFRVTGGYFTAKDFISLLGIPYFGAVSTKNEGAVYDDPQTCFMSVEYSRSFGKHYAFGAKADLYYSFPGTMTMADGTMVDSGTATSFSFGVFLRVNPSFLIKKFK